MKYITAILAYLAIGFVLGIIGNIAYELNEARARRHIWSTYDFPKPTPIDEFLEFCQIPAFTMAVWPMILAIGGAYVCIAYIVRGYNCFVSAVTDRFVDRLEKKGD